MGFVPQTSWLRGLAENAVDTLEGGAGPSPGCLVDLTVNMWVYWCVGLIPWSGNHFGRVLMLAKSSHQMDRASPPEQEPLWRGASASQGCPLGGGGWSRFGGAGWVESVISQGNTRCPVLANLMENDRNGTCQCKTS